MAHEFQAHFVWDVRENVLGGMTIHLAHHCSTLQTGRWSFLLSNPSHPFVRPSIHPSSIHAIPLQYITSQYIYIYILYIQYMYISSYIHTRTHTHTYCVLVGTCNTAVHKTPSRIILSGITLSPLMFWEAKRMKPIKRTKHFELGTDSKKGKNELLAWRTAGDWIIRESCGFST